MLGERVDSWYKIKDSDGLPSRGLNTQGSDQ